MSVESNNATPPTPAIAPAGPGVPHAHAIDVRKAAEAIALRGMDPRVQSLIPAFDAPFFQAGLAGYSDAAMRIVARRQGCPFCVTEALLDRTLLAGGRGFDKADLGDLHDNIPGGAEDHPLAGQIMGSEPREMAAGALKMVEQKARSDKDYRKIAYGVANPAQIGVKTDALRLPGGEQIEWVSCGEDEDDAESCDPGELIDPAPDADESALSGPSAAANTASFEVIDVNLACPVKKIERKARGGHWLTEPKGAIEILEAVREAVPAHIPCTVKLRRAFDDTPEMAANFDTILAAATDMGYAWATVHARTVVQKYVGPSRWDLLRRIVQKHPKSVIFGSGDIWNAGDIFRMMTYAGVSGASVARGCIGNPWIFRQARDLLAGREPLPPTVAEQRDVLRQHFDLSLAVTRRFRHGEDATSKMMRKFGIRFATHHPRREQVRQKMIAISSMADWQNVLDEFYAPGQ